MKNTTCIPPLWEMAIQGWGILNPERFNYNSCTPYQLVVGQSRASRVGHEPPSSSTNSSKSYVESNGHVTEEQPSSDQTFFRVTWGYRHDVWVRRVERESGGRETVSYKVNPQELDRDQGFGETKGSSQEDTAGKYRLETCFIAMWFTKYWNKSCHPFKL